MTTTIERDVLQVLSACRVDGATVLLPPGQLDRKLYLRVNKVLEALGGKWDRRAKAHVFPTDPAGVLDDAIVTGGYAHPKDEFGFFVTPPGVADVVANLAGLKEGMRVLEPSAGTGALVNACLARVPSLEISCVELQYTLAAGLRLKYETRRNPKHTVVEGDFLTQRAEALGVRTSFDRVVMNPPFARGQDVDHVTHALEFLRPGGRLVSIMSAGVEFRQDRRYAEFRALGPKIERLPELSFRASGTDVSTVVVVLEKKS